ncbi:MAG: response regulator [Planctomycetia bacterium]|nr:response regulator [Planctomycetia bacterium]
MLPQTVLVVDDSPTAQRIIRLAVEAGGYRVLSASDGDEAIAVAMREVPDLIVLDIILPKKNGFQVCRHLKAFPETCGIKVVLLSSKNHEMDILWGKRQGADGYLTKPFDAGQLVSCIDSVLRGESIAADTKLNVRASKS